MAFSKHLSIIDYPNPNNDTVILTKTNDQKTSKIVLKCVAIGFIILGSLGLATQIETPAAPKPIIASGVFATK